MQQRPSSKVIQIKVNDHNYHFTKTTGNMGYNTDLLQRVTRIVFPFCSGMRGSSVNGG